MQTPADLMAAGRERVITSPEQLLADVINGGSPASYGEPRWGADRRGAQTAEARLDAADERDAIAAVRDRAARTRDDAAEDRGCAPEQGAFAAGDRQAAAQDREQAARERLHALVDREILADELAITHVDPLTGARTRAAGLADLDREMDRCRRTGAPLVVTYVDVVGLKALNDTVGHRAGDDLLKHVVESIQAHLRPYDLVIRLGGDEFLCAMSSMSPLDARERFAIIAAALSVAPAATAIRAGFATLEPGDSAAELIARADDALIGGGHAEHESRSEATARRRPHERWPARPESVGPLRRAIDEFAASGGASQRQREDIGVAVSEALTNAVVHAYDGAVGVLAVDAWMSARSLNVVVCDEGGGMLPRTSTRGIGLGLGLIVRMTRKLAIEESEHGMRVRMTFAIG